MNKICWTLARPASSDKDAFRREALADLPARIIELVPGAASIAVTLQAPDEYSGAMVPVEGHARPADALVEVEVVNHFVALDAIHEVLNERSGHFQGWRVRSTLIYDSSAPSVIGEPSLLSACVAFVERLDGTTPDHFDQNWYVHAGHPDGIEAESAASLAERAREEAELPGWRYVQNRVIEPVTPTAWLIHGYTQLLAPGFTPSLEGAEPYERVRGEEPFDRFPPRILQGHEYRVR